MDLKRIFVGNLHPDTDRNRILALFKNHGDVVDFSSHYRFVFVEYATEESAKSAVESLHGTNFLGCRLKVEPAMKAMKVKSFRDRSPLVRHYPSNDCVPINVCCQNEPKCLAVGNQAVNQNSPVAGSQCSRVNPGRPCVSTSVCLISPNNAANNLEGVITCKNNHSNLEYTGAVKHLNHRGANSYAMNTLPGRYDQNYNRNRLTQDFSQDSSFTSEVKVNDIEVIVFLKSDKDYAEYIEGRLKAMGFSVDILFPNRNALASILSNLADKGSLYAVILLPEHKIKRSFNLLVLYGEPQEHQNILLEDGLELIERNYESYRRAEMIREKKNSHEVPKKIKLLLEIVLSEVQSLSVENYNELILYFTQQKMKAEMNQASENSSLVKEHLTSRILDILDKNKSSCVPDSSTSSNPSFSSLQGVQSIPFLHNPEALQAIENLIQSSKIIDQIIRPNNQS